MYREQLEAILNKAHKLRSINRWLPFVSLSISNADRMCNPEYGKFAEDFIRNGVLNTDQSDRFYVNLPYWSSYRAIKKDDLVLPVHKFMKSVDSAIEK